MKSSRHSSAGAPAAAMDATPARMPAALYSSPPSSGPIESPMHRPAHIGRAGGGGGGGWRAGLARRRAGPEQARVRASERRLPPLCRPALARVARAPTAVEHRDGADLLGGRECHRHHHQHLEEVDRRRGALAAGSRNGSGGRGRGPSGGSGAAHADGGRRLRACHPRRQPRGVCAFVRYWPPACATAAAGPRCSPRAPAVGDGGAPAHAQRPPPPRPAPRAAPTCTVRAATKTGNE